MTKPDEMLQTNGQDLKQRPNWDEVRKLYHSKKIGLRELARVTGIPFPTVAARCKAEEWASSRGKLQKIAKDAAVESAKAQGEKLGMTAVDLELRSLGMAERLLGKIEDLLESGDLSPGSLRDLCSSFRTTVDVTRLTLRMDEQRDEPSCVVDVKIMNALAESILFPQDHAPMGFDRGRIAHRMEERLEKEPVVNVAVMNALPETILNPPQPVAINPFPITSPDAFGGGA